MNENLNKILGQLEEDLKNIQSANSLVTNTHKLVEGLTTSTKTAVEQFNEKLKVSTSSINKVVTESIS